jgi:integrase
MPRPKRLAVRSVRRHGREQFLVDLRPFGGTRRLFDSIVAAQQALLQAQLRQTPKPGTPGCNPEMTVAEVAARFLQAKQRKAGQTYRRYRSDLEVHILPRFGAWQWAQLDRGSAYAFLGELRDAPIVRHRRGPDGRPVLVTVPGKRRSPSTIRGILATLSALASFAVDVCQLGDHNPFLRLAGALDLQVTTASRRAHAKKKTLTAPQVARLLAQAAAAGGSLFPLPVCVLRAGLRIGEVLALRPEDLDLDTADTAGRETLRVARARTVDRAGQVAIEDPKTEAGLRRCASRPPSSRCSGGGSRLIGQRGSSEPAGARCRPGSSLPTSTRRRMPPTTPRQACSIPATCAARSATSPRRCTRRTWRAGCHLSSASRRRGRRTGADTRSQPSCSKPGSRPTTCASFSATSRFGRRRTSTGAAAILMQRRDSSTRSIPSPRCQRHQPGFRQLFVGEALDPRGRPAPDLPNLAKECPCERALRLLLALRRLLRLLEGGNTDHCRRSAVSIGEAPREEMMST